MKDQPYLRIESSKSFLYAIGRAPPGGLSVCGEHVFEDTWSFPYKHATLFNNTFTKFAGIVAWRQFVGVPDPKTSTCE